MFSAAEASTVSVLRAGIGLRIVEGLERDLEEQLVAGGAGVGERRGRSVP